MRTTSDNLVLLEDDDADRMCECRCTRQPARAAPDDDRVDGVWELVLREPLHSQPAALLFGGYVRGKREELERHEECEE